MKPLAKWLSPKAKKRVVKYILNDQPVHRWLDNIVAEMRKVSTAMIITGIVAGVIKHQLSGLILVIVGAIFLLVCGRPKTDEKEGE